MAARTAAAIVLLAIVLGSALYQVKALQALNREGSEENQLGRCYSVTEQLQSAGTTCASRKSATRW
jgi:hypothetical protein